MKLRKLLVCIVLLAGAMHLSAMNLSQENVSVRLSLKVPGNEAKSYELSFNKQSNGTFEATTVEKLPVVVVRQVNETGDKQRITVTLKALENIYFNYGEQVNTGFNHADCQFYMPGFWYRKNLRSPKEAPSFHTSDSWLVREDRLSTPLTAAFNAVKGKSMSVIRIDKFDKDALTTHKEGEVILSGETSIGYTGFENVDGKTVLSYGFPYP